MAKQKNGTRTIGDLTPAPYNPRKIDAQRLRMLGDSMGEFGDLSGIVFNRRTGRLIGGHQRLKHIPDSAPIHVDQEYGEPTQAGRSGRGNHEGSLWFGDNSQTTVFHVDSFNGRLYPIPKCSDIGTR